MTRGLRLTLLAFACLIAAFALRKQPSTWRLPMEPTAMAVRANTLPSPALLRLPPDFQMKRTHPRLPVPARFAPRPFPAVRNPHAALFPELMPLLHAARTQPDHIDFALLHAKLLALAISGRGVDQAKTLAVAYDWLYDRWTAAQRNALLLKTLEACEYQIAYIRVDKLSPYNVILYNALLQGLMTCALATYGDHPRATPIMAFTHELWINRTLPVWRQVMGRSGGWHEGGEYAGIGIGQAIYQLPNMWRQATGEDLFQTEPALRGHLDFLIHRTLPDGTYLPWGDAAYFDRYSPDAIALALEYRHAAAYWSLMNDDITEPTSWPAGPPLDTTLRDMTAQARMPLSALFDGIGTVFARSAWSPDATHVSFRAGDNYWSHTHLDQGAFTIYKGGPLAIDSGLYYSAGSDHHMNYTYQSVAHNTLTVTDPADTVPGPPRFDGRGSSRAVANDGGQRRIGSGWGVEEAPLDEDEWREKRATYHTGTVEAYAETDGVTVAVADITPAYTNLLSGRGDFSARTRRVERFWRVLVYDRVNDVVVVFDNTASTRAEFKKRWLLHSVEWPRIDPGGFLLSLSPDPARGHTGGTLRGWVLLPERAIVDAVGGDGQEFWVDGHNYDDRGLARRMLARLPPTKAHPGAWRLEISPRDAREHDFFLVVMAPSLGEQVAHHAVKLLRHGDLIGAQVHGDGRSTRCWYAPDRNGVWIDVTDAQGTRRHYVPGTSRAGGPLDLEWIKDIFNPG